MEKDFQNWHKLKSTIDKSHTAPLFSEREVWWSSIGMNVGSEINGKHELFERPVLIVKKFNQEMFFGLPITTTKKGGRYFVKIPFSSLKKDSVGNLSQMRVFSAKRLIRKMGKLGEKPAFTIKQMASQIFW